MRPARFFIALALVAGLFAIGAPVNADDDARSPTDPRIQSDAPSRR